MTAADHHRLLHDITQLHQASDTKQPKAAAASSSSSVAAASSFTSGVSWHVSSWSTRIPRPILDSCFFEYGGFTGSFSASTLAHVCHHWYTYILSCPAARHVWRRCYARDFWLSVRPLPAWNTAANEASLIPWPPGHRNQPKPAAKKAAVAAPAKKKAKKDEPAVAVEASDGKGNVGGPPEWAGSSDESYYLQAKGKNGKYWEGFRFGSMIIVRFGKVGTNSGSSINRLADASAASTHLTKTVATKKKGGYKMMVAPKERMPGAHVKSINEVALLQGYVPLIKGRGGAASDTKSSKTKKDDDDDDDDGTSTIPIGVPSSWIDCYRVAYEHEKRWLYGVNKCATFTDHIKKLPLGSIKQITRTAFSNDWNLCAIMDQHEFDIHIMRMDTGERLWSLTHPMIGDHTDQYGCSEPGLPMCISGHYLTMMYLHEQLVVWSLVTGKRIHTIKRPTRFGQDSMDDKHYYFGCESGITVYNLATGNVVCRIPINIRLMSADSVHALPPPSVDDTRRVLMVRHKGNVIDNDRDDKGDGKNIIGITRVIIYDDGRYVFERTPHLLAGKTWRWRHRVAIQLEPELKSAAVARGTGGKGTPAIDTLNIIDMWPSSPPGIPLGRSVKNGTQHWSIAQERVIATPRHSLHIPLHRLSTDCLFKCADYTIDGHVVQLRCGCRQLHIVSLRPHPITGLHRHIRVPLPRSITLPILPADRATRAEEWRAEYQAKHSDHEDNSDMCVTSLSPNGVVNVAPDDFEFGETFFN